MKAVIYGAKSTEDVHGSIPTQLADCRALAERQGWEVVGEFSDEAFSAYHGNRGPDLALAKALAVQTAAQDGRCVLVAQDADRFARGAGDAPGAADHLGELYFAMRRQGVALWSVRSGELDLLRAALEGERATSESARKSQAVTAGLKRRAERGQPVGALPIGYTAEPTLVAGQVITQRVVDAERAPVVRRMFDLAARRSTPGEISRRLNAEGATTIRGKTWTVRAVRTVLRNEDYAGRNGYPKLVEPEQFDAVQRWLDESGRNVQGQPRVGRPPAADFPLAGIARCSLCGAAMRSRRCSVTGRRTYRCANAMEGRHSCADSVPVPAVEAESQLVHMLRYATGDLESVLATQVEDRHREQSERKAALKARREQQRKLATVRERHLAEYRRLVDDERSTAYLALDEVERLDGERERLDRAVMDAEAVLAEHADQPDAEEVRDLIRRLYDYARQQVDNADTASELGAVVRRLFAEVRLGATDKVPLVQASLRLGDNPHFTFV
jgi:site-specific DNA recombinase